MKTQYLVFKYTLLFSALLFFITTVVSASPIDLSTLQLNGNGPTTDWYPRLIDGGNTLRLLPNYDINDPAHPTDGQAQAGPSPAASAFYRTQLPVQDGFTTTFQFRMGEQTGGWDNIGPFAPPNSPTGADGIAFVIQNDPGSGSNALGWGAGGIGYQWISNGIAIEFDTWKNMVWYGDPPLVLTDYNANHISLHSSRSMVNNFLVPHHECIAADCTLPGTYPTGTNCVQIGDGSPSQTEPYNGILTSKGCVSPYWPGWPGYFVTDYLPYHCLANPDLGSYRIGTLALNDGNWHTVKIEYIPPPAKTFNVYLDDMVTPVLTVNNVDLGQLLNGEATTLCEGTAYVGFTSGERGGYQNHDIRSWDYESSDSCVPVPIPEFPTLALPLITILGLLLTVVAVRRMR